MATSGKIPKATPRGRSQALNDRFDFPTLSEMIAERLAKQYPELTARERLVCGYTLAGYTAEAIGLILGVGMSTVITYRRRAYSRLGICNANQLIAPLLI